MSDTKKPSDIASELLNQEPETNQAESSIAASALASQDVDAIANEAMLEQKYGDQSLRTAVERAASAASFGLTDQALVKGAELFNGSGEAMREGLREREKRNREAALAGEVAGVAGPALASGGSSLLAKTAGAGVKTAAKAGAAAERLTAKQLAKVLQQTTNKKTALDVIKKSIPKTAGSAVEGSLYGTGQLLKEDALGTSQFNAENLIASASTGALLSGAATSLFGSAEALIPVIKNNKVVDVVSKKVRKNIDPNLAAAKYSGATTAGIEKLKQNSWGNKIYNNLAPYYKKNLGLTATESLEKTLKKSNADFAAAGQRIGTLVDKVDDIAAGTNMLPTKSKVALQVQNSLYDLADVLRKNPDEVAKKQVKAIESRIKSWNDWLANDNPISAKDIKELKTALQKSTKWNKSIDQLPIQGKMDREIAESVRNVFMDLADNVSTVDANLGKQLRQANLDYATAMFVNQNLNKAVAKAESADLIKFKDLLLADIAMDASSGGIGAAALISKKFLESDLKKKLTILSAVEKSNQSVERKLSKGVKNFMSKIRKTATPVSTKILLTTKFRAPSDDGSARKKPKNKQEAFKQVSDDIQKLVSDQEVLMDKLNSMSSSVSEVAPDTAQSMRESLLNALSFLDSKLPRDPSSNPGLFKRPWQPSTLELAKFERYLAAVENPMSVIEDFESGTLTREGVEALQSVYPDLYARIVEKTTIAIQKNPELPYDKRLQAGVLLGIDADSSLIGTNIAALQQTFTDLEQQQNAARKEPESGETEISQSRAEAVDFASDAQSGTEKVATRK